MVKLYGDVLEGLRIKQRSNHIRVRYRILKNMVTFPCSKILFAHFPPAKPPLSNPLSFPFPNNSPLHSLASQIYIDITQLEYILAAYPKMD